MPVSLNTVIAALDTPSSLLPFFVKDAFDITGRTAMAQSEGGKHEAREKFIEEAGTSLFWVAGIPIVRGIANKLFKHKLDTDIHFKRINSSGIQGYFAGDVLQTVKENGKDVVKNKFSKEDLVGIQLGGKKLAEVQEKLKKSGFVVNGAKGKYKTFHMATTTTAVLFNLFMLAVALPKFNQYLSKKIIEKEVNDNAKKAEKESNQHSNKVLAGEFTFGASNKKTFEQFLGQKNNTAKKVSFGSLKDFFKIKMLPKFEKMTEDAQLSATGSMLILDYGISGSRVTFVPRDNNERVEYAVKEGGIILFFYYAADFIKKGLAKMANKFFKTPIDLDYKVIQSKEFLNNMKKPQKKEELLNFVKVAENDNKSELKIIKLIDKELANTSESTKKENVFKNFTLKMAQTEGLVDVEYDEGLNKWIRNSKKYIETDKLIELNKKLNNFYEKAFAQIKDKANNKTLDQIVSKTKNVKMASVLANMAICCAALSYVLPKIQYMIREHRTQTKSAPGIKVYQELAKKKQLLA